MLFFTWPRAPTFHYIKTVIEGSESTSTFKLNNYDYYSVKWTDPAIRVSWLDTSTSPSTFWLIAQTCGDSVPDEYVWEPCNSNATASWTTGSRRSKQVDIPTQVVKGSVADVALYCRSSKNPSPGYVKFATSGNIKAKSGISDEKIDLNTKYYWYTCVDF